jgi:predicted alpha/beta-hydrolase family hydrolase
MKIYLASRYSRYPEMQQVAQDLAQLGHTVTSRWILGDHDRRTHGASESARFLPLWADEDWQDLLVADVCISFTEGPGEAPGRSRGGRHVEHGIALATGKRCLVVGYRENVFHWLPRVEFFPTWAACRAWVSMRLEPQP